MLNPWSLLASLHVSDAVPVFYHLHLVFLILIRKRLHNMSVKVWKRYCNSHQSQGPLWSFNLKTEKLFSLAIDLDCDLVCFVDKKFAQSLFICLLFQGTHLYFVGLLAFAIKAKIF